MVQFLAGTRNFFFIYTVFIPALGLIQHPIQWISRGLKQERHEADHSAPSSAEVKNGGTVAAFPHTST
jgi:hypothetical protein